VSCSGHNLIALLLLAAAAPEVVRQDAERERLEVFLKRYHGLIDAYRDGDDKTVTEIITWERKRLTDVVNAIQTPADVQRRWDQARFKAAAMLHTDAAIRATESDDTRAAFQLQLASQLLFTGGPDLRPFARTWYVTVTRVLRDRARPFIAEALLERARQHLPGDAVVLYESAVLQELIATFSAFVTETTAPTRPFADSPAQDIRNLDNTRAAVEDRRIKTWRANTDKAARWLNDALKADPSSELAQLHLGRVSVLRGNHEDASRLLQRLIASAADVNISYLASMFLGAMHDRRGHYDDAERMYRQAIARVPSAQSGYIALSQLLQKRGRGSESREVVTTMLQHDAEARTEPWWWYLADSISEVRQRIDALRASVRK
jgi:tetratricopeptide (TPR) repeat protein